MSVCASCGATEGLLTNELFFLRASYAIVYVYAKETLCHDCGISLCLALARHKARNHQEVRRLVEEWDAGAEGRKLWREFTKKWRATR